MVTLDDDLTVATAAPCARSSRFSLEIDPQKLKSYVFGWRGKETKSHEVKLLMFSAVGSIK